VKETPPLLRLFLCGGHTDRVVGVLGGTSGAVGDHQGKVHPVAAAT